MVKKLLWLASHGKVLKEEGCVNSPKVFGGAILKAIPSWKPGLRVLLKIQRSGYCPFPCKETQAGD